MRTNIRELIKKRDNPPATPTHWVSWLNMLTGMWWVYLFTLPGSLFKTNPAFNGLADHAPEWTWSLSIFVAVALSALSFLRPCSVMCLLALLVQSGIWAGVATCLGLSAPVINHTPVNTGCGVYGAMSLLNFLLACTHGEAAIDSAYRWEAFRKLTTLRQSVARFRHNRTTWGKPGRG